MKLRFFASFFAAILFINTGTVAATGQNNFQLDDVPMDVSTDQAESEIQTEIVEPTLGYPRALSQSGTFFDGVLQIAGAKVVWSTETTYFPSGCSSFYFVYSNETGGELPRMQLRILDFDDNQISTQSDIYIPRWTTGMWTTQICGHQLKYGPEFYLIQLLVRDSSNTTYVDEDYLWFNGISGTWDNFVMNLFWDFTSRPATYDEISKWSANLRYGTWSKNTVTSVMASSEPYIQSMISRFYLDTLGREPDQAGYQFWVSTAKNGRPLADIGSFFYGSDEYFQGYGNGNNADWIRDLYVKLMLRSADPGGLNYWVGQLNSGAMNRTQVAMWFYQSPEKRGLRVDSLYNNLLGRDPDPGGRAYWASRLATEGDIGLSNMLASSSEYFYKQFRLL